MGYLVGSVIGIYLAIACFHLYWGFGGRFAIDFVIPKKENKPLFLPSKGLTLLVSLLIFSFAGVFYLLYFNDLNSSKLILAGWLISGIFIVRAVGEFNAVGFFKRLKNTEFAKYDTLIFSPLSLLLGLSSAFITYEASL